MKEEKVYYYGVSMGRSMLILGFISLISGMLLSYFILRDISVTFSLLVEFWRMTLLLLLFFVMGVLLICNGVVVWKKSANKVVLLRLSSEGIINYEHNITINWKNIDDVIYIGFRNKHGIGVKMKHKELLLNQLPLHKRLVQRLFGLSLFDALPGEYIAGDGRAVHREIKEYYERVRVVK
ncbi:hypothetical protein LNQ81_04265 [Myroides sp. M-43]|uniref:hypothetical protein n=1 Tax=Myroides oncorhynchi TaxID=2893756 RepID=UPI001E46F0E7|nr:hypothetical protein [Myroides oncorhynchi]MCC9041916.1 hypothetical protein [Myroides oncorhynchi]